MQLKTALLKLIGRSSEIAMQGRNVTAAKTVHSSKELQQNYTVCADCPKQYRKELYYNCDEEHPGNFRERN